MSWSLGNYSRFHNYPHFRIRARLEEVHGVYDVMSVEYIKYFFFFFIFKKNLVQVFISNLFCIRLNIVPKNTTQEIFAIINHPFEKYPLIFFFIAVYLVSFIFAINFTSILTLSFDLYILQINAF